MIAGRVVGERCASPAPMSALGQKQTCAVHPRMSALCQKQTLPERKKNLQPPRRNEPAGF